MQIPSIPSNINFIVTDLNCSIDLTTQVDNA